MTDDNQPLLIGIILDVSNSMQESWNQRDSEKSPRFDEIRKVINGQLSKMTSISDKWQKPIEVFCLGMGFQKKITFEQVNLDDNEELIEGNEDNRPITQSNVVCDLLALNEIVPTITEQEYLEKSLNDKWNTFAHQILAETWQGLDANVYSQLTSFIENGLHESAYKCLHQNPKYRLYKWLENSSIRYKWRGVGQLFNNLFRYADVWEVKIESSCSIEAENFFYRIQNRAELLFEENKAKYIQFISERLRDFATSQIRIILELLTVGHSVERVIDYFDEDRTFAIAEEIYNHLNREVEDKIRIPLIQDLGSFLKDMRFELRASLSKKKLTELTSQCIKKYAWEILEPFVKQEVFDLVQECFTEQARKMFLYWVDIASSREVIQFAQEINGILPEVANEDILRNQYMFGTTPIKEALNLASIRLLNLKYQTHKKVLIVISDGEFEFNESGQSIQTPINVIASQLKKSGITVVSLYITNKSIVKKLVSRISASWPSGAKTMFEIASEVSEDREFIEWLQKRNYNLPDKSKKLFIQINEAKLLQKIFAGIFHEQNNPASFN